MAFAVWLTLLAVPVILLDNFSQPGAGAGQPVATDGRQRSTTADAVTVVTAGPTAALHSTTTAPPASAPPTTAPTTSAPTTAAPPPTQAVMALAQALVEPPPDVADPPPETPPAEPVNAEEGGASWYRYIEGTCAHRTLPKGTVVTVTNLATGTSTVCTVADRGPYIDGRIIDLDATVFDDLAPLSSGVIDVRITW